MIFIFLIVEDPTETMKCRSAIKTTLLQQVKDVHIVGKVEDTKGVPRSHQSEKDNTKGAPRSHQLEKDRQYNINCSQQNLVQ